MTLRLLRFVFAFVLSLGRMASTPAGKTLVDKIRTGEAADNSGIQSDGVAHHKNIVHPHPPAPQSPAGPEPIHWVKAHYDSIRRRISVLWHRTENPFELNIANPANTIAMVYVPVGNADAVRPGWHTVAHTDVCAVSPSARRVRGVVAAESGKYSFVSHLPGDPAILFLSPTT